MTSASRTIDLNADLGEGFGHWRMGDDDAMLDIVTSANVACGFHAGDPDIMATTFARAKEKGVAVGAHVAFPDLAGFGRRSLPMSAREIERAVAYQLGAAQALAALSGHRITHVKAHGALANIAERDADVANAIARAVRGVDPSLALLAIALSEQTLAGARAGLRVVNEIFADRAYMDDGRLQPRSRRRRGYRGYRKSQRPRARHARQRRSQDHQRRTLADADRLGLRPRRFAACG